MGVDHVAQGVGGGHSGREHVTVPTRRRCWDPSFRRRAFCIGALLTLPIIAATGNPAHAQTGCEAYNTYSIVASAEGVRTVARAPGITLADEVDVNGPAAQAQVDSIQGSIGWAGSPYSETVVGNVGLTGQSPNDVPTVARSVHPGVPEASKELPGVTLAATSTQFTSTGDATAGGPSGDNGTGNNTASAEATCETDGSVRATAHSTTDGLVIAGVLRIASTASHAEVVIGADGTREISATMVVDGATVLGQPIAITDQGVVTGGSATPLPEDSLTAALADAGITVRYVDAIIDEQNRHAVAPGLEITVAGQVPTVGTAPQRVTHIIGRAFARVDLGGGHPTATTTTITAPATTPSTVAPPLSAEPTPAPTTPSPTEAPSITEVAAPPTPAAPAGFRASQVLASWSIAPAYYALGLGTTILFALRAASERIARRLTWS